MTLVTVLERNLTLRLTIDELLTINNALNEVCNGIEVPEFHARIGASLDQVRLLLSSVGNAIEKASQRH